MVVQLRDQTKSISEAIASYSRLTLQEVREARVANELTRRLARERFEARRKATRQYMRKHPEVVSGLRV